jgi:dimethylargininase
LNEPNHALVRRLPQSYVDYYARRNVIIDAELANRQHHQYVQALEAAGLKMAEVAADETFPDCVFIEDTAVLCKGHALIASLENADREGEQAAVEAALQKTHKIVHLEPGAKLDGGDVMRVEDTFYVGLSARTNEAGASGLKNFAADFGIRTIAIPVKHCLHLKTGVTYLGNGTLLAAPQWFNFSRFEVNDVIPTGQGEEAATNTLRIHNHLLMVDGYPNTRSSVEAFANKHNLKLTALATTEFAKANGSLTCMSLIW